MRDQLLGTTQPVLSISRHIGMFDAAVALQVAEVQGSSGRDDDTYPCAVLSGPGDVWLRSTPSSPGQPEATPR